MEDIRLPVKKLEKDDEDWDSAFESIHHPYVRIDIGNDECLNFLAGLTEVHWILGLHYVFKCKWNSKHKIPVKLKPTSQKAFRLWGDYLYTILELCIQCHASPSTRASYTNAAEWFERVAWEMKNNDFNAPLSAKKGMKRESIAQQRELLKALKRYENPLDPQIDHHSFALIESALNLAERSDIFYKKYWKPLLTAFTRLLEDMENNPDWQTVFENDGLPYVQMGRGNRILPYPGVQQCFKIGSV